ncbi:TonB-dependent receptor [Sphingomonas aracearum]|uniref:TonB-dependent receptor n=1 Tax=Sphingomonas aracearum TaxID=2283317 RepID=UPI0015F06E9B|nr:TonB-dependent receptor [Sphingomonas aracearum]
MSNSTSFARKALRGGSALQALALLGAGVMGAAAFAAPAAAQDTTAGSISGVVRDVNGQPVPGATIVLESTGRGFQRTTTSSSNGTFTVPQLPIGPYNATVSAPNFQTTRTEGLTSELGGASYNLTIAAVEAGAGGDIVVTAVPERTLDFSGTATGQVFNVQETARTLPVARNITAIQLLAPQATSGDSAFGGVSLGGSSVAENIYYINGMNVTNFRTGVGGTTIPFEFYDSVQVKTGGYQAEFGRNTGGAVIAVSRSGTNEFHGGINLYWEPNALRSDVPNTYSANNSLDARERIEGNIWASGPIIKDRLFFFAFFNPRDFYQKDVAQAETFNTAGTVSNGFSNTSISEQNQNNPFFGGKLDLNLFDGHRLEATYFSDSSDNLVSQYTVGAAANANPARVRNFAGGDNYIFRYTGAFTDWLTISALYGKSKYNQSSIGTDDAIPYTVDARSGTAFYVAGNPNGQIENGRDSRNNYRVDVDLTFSLLGQHRVRFGGDYEKLTAEANTVYSGGFYYRYARTPAAGALVNATAVAGNTDYVRVRTYDSGGTFESKNTAFYIQDSWDITPRLNLNLGVRYDKFENLNASGDTFTKLDNQFAPRVGFSYDLFGDRSTRLNGFYGRYYLPVAANTNIRMAGNESFLERYYTFSGPLANPTLLTQLGGQNVLSDSNNVDPQTLVSQNLKPQYLDEFLLGIERRVGSRMKVTVNGIYRKLGAVLEDVDTRYSVTAFCRTQNLPGCNATRAPTGALGTSGALVGQVNPSVGGAVIGSGGYVLINPGSDLIVNADLTNSGTLSTITIPSQYLGFPKAERIYKAMEFKFEREFDGKWGLNGSYVLGLSKGNYEGGVKSDNGQDDTGLTQDFDEPGWMDGSYGLLPNHRRHTLKLYGSYKPFENLLLGFNGVVQSPRKFGCIGTYPYADGRAAITSAASWYCSNPLATGLPLVAGSTPTLQNPGQTAPVLVGRGNAFQSDWLKQLDVSVQFRVPIEGLNGLTLRADVFNVFNTKSELDYNETGDDGTLAGSLRNYGRVTGYQSPRYVRFGMSLDF